LHFPTDQYSTIKRSSPQHGSRNPRQRPQCAVQRARDSEGAQCSPTTPIACGETKSQPRPPQRYWVGKLRWRTCENSGCCRLSHLSIVYNRELATAKATLPGRTLRPLRLLVLRARAQACSSSELPTRTGGTILPGSGGHARCTAGQDQRLLRGRVGVPPKQDRLHADIVQDAKSVHSTCLTIIRTSVS
jgi:hypothetical protein